MPKPRNARRTRARSARPTRRSGLGAPAAARQREALPIINTDPLARVTSARDLFWNNILREMLTNLAALSAQRSCTQPQGRPEAAKDRTEAPGVVGSPASSTETREGPARPEARARHNRDELDLEEPQEDPEVEPSPDESGEEEGDTDTRVRVGEHEFHATLGSDPGNIFDGRLGVVTSWGQRIPIAEITPVFACGLPSKDRNWLSTAVECTVFEVTTPAGEVFTLPVSHIIAFHSLSEELIREIQHVLHRQRGRGDDLEQPFGFAAFTSLARSQGSLGEVPPLAPDSIGE